VRATRRSRAECPFPPFNRSFEVIVTEDDGLLLGKPWHGLPRNCSRGLPAWCSRWVVVEARTAVDRATRTWCGHCYGWARDDGRELSGGRAARLTCVLPTSCGFPASTCIFITPAAKTLDRVPYGPTASRSPSGLPSEGSLLWARAACFRNQALLIIRRLSAVHSSRTTAAASSPAR